MRRLAIFLLATTACGYTGDSVGIGGASGGGGGGTTVEAGQLTAGEWDDNANFEWFQRTLDGDFAEMRERATLALDGRIVATITDAAGEPIAGAQIEVIGTTNRIIAGTDGRVVLLPALDGDGMLRVIAPDGATLETPARDTITIANAVAAPASALDLAFVVDATGSMGDEISYLQAEIRSIASRVASTYPALSIRFALVVYRDLGDEYVTRVFDFASLDSFHASLLDQAAGGGGDYPEAAERAMLDAMTQLTWRDGNVARTLFHVADAPPHDEQYGAYLEQALAARTKGVRIFPVAASGVALEAEYLMRSSALATAGRYIFLTDDSGIGESHEDPRIPCYRVERLATLLARTLDSELAGHYIAPAAEDVLRTEGTYEGDTCVVPE